MTVCRDYRCDCGYDSDCWDDGDDPAGHDYRNDCDYGCVGRDDWVDELTEGAVGVGGGGGAAVGGGGFATDRFDAVAAAAAIPGNTKGLGVIFTALPHPTIIS